MNNNNNNNGGSMNNNNNGGSMNMEQRKEQAWDWLIKTASVSEDKRWLEIDGKGRYGLLNRHTATPIGWAENNKYHVEYEDGYLFAYSEGIVVQVILRYVYSFGEEAIPATGILENLPDGTDFSSALKLKDGDRIGDFTAMYWLSPTYLKLKEGEIGLEEVNESFDDQSDDEYGFFETQDKDNRYQFMWDSRHSYYRDEAAGVVLRDVDDDGHSMITAITIDKVDFDRILPMDFRNSWHVLIEQIEEYEQKLMKEYEQTLQEERSDEDDF